VLDGRGAVLNNGEAMLLERSEQLEALRRLAPGTLALIRGEAGVGKTALVKRFAEAQPHPVLWGACEALFTPRPLAPFADMEGLEDLPPYRLASQLASYEIGRAHV